MTLSSGTHLGPYEIVASIGAGGMGEVYRAKDTRLDRSVAVKILPSEMASNAQLRARFEREAKTISQLNHPNICTLHDVGENFLVMELLEGETLADRVMKGPLPIEQVLRYGAEIARALDGAHRHGVTHRDLKPANVMITRTGAKVLDFGLAKPGHEEVINLGTTVQRSLTAEGTIVGTFQYMAPEQLEGQRVDHRTDIFALGAVLYEMATGHRAFDGKTKTSVIAAIVAATPKPIHELQPLTPPAFERLVAKCLAKDPDERWQSAHDVADELAWIAETMGRDDAPRRRSARPWMIATAALALLAIGGIAAAVVARRSVEDPPLSMSLSMPQRLLEFFNQAELSPDGRTVAFVGYTSAGSSLWVRSLEELVPRALPNTEGAWLPFWSPDGKSLGFFADGKLKRIAVAGGPPVTICEAPVAFGGTWNADGVIVFSAGFTDPLFRVSAAGGKPQRLTTLDKGEEAHRWPAFLPDGEHFVFLADAPRTEDHHLRLGSLKDGRSTILTQAVTNAKVVEPSTLMFVRGSALLAQTLDLERKALTGEPRVLAQDLQPNAGNHHFEFTASRSGRLLYRSVTARSQLAWVDRTGKLLGRLGETNQYDDFRLAPDQKRVAFTHFDADGRSDDIWLLDVNGGGSTRFTFDGASDFMPVWSPDGKRIAFGSMRSALGNAFLADVNNPAAAEQMTREAQTTVIPTDWSRDGRFVLLTFGKGTDADVYLYSLETKKLRPYIATPFNEADAMFSPDGTRIAYVSSESGQDEVYVEQFPSRAERRQIGRGYSPRWRGDGKELFFQTERDYRVVDMTVADAQPQVLFSGITYKFDVASDGQRLLLAQRLEDVTRVPLTFVTNWQRLAAQQ